MRFGVWDANRLKNTPTCRQAATTEWLQASINYIMICAPSTGGLSGEWWHEAPLPPRLSKGSVPSDDRLLVSV